MTDRKPPLRAFALGYVAVTLIFTTALAWPVYDTGWLAAVAAGGGVFGIALAWWSTRRRWAAWLTTAVAVLGYAILGVPLAIPATLAQPRTIPGSILDVFTGIVLGWKQLLTLDIPLGTYQGVLVPFFALTLVGALIAAVLALRLDAWANLGVIVLLCVGLFGIAFGATAGGPAWNLFGLPLGAGLQVVLALLLVAVSFTWLTVRARLLRQLALALSTGMVRSTGRESFGAKGRRTLLASGMLALALVLGLVLASGSAGVTLRSTLRTGAEPYLVIQTQGGLLDTYRANFVTGVSPTPLFTVTGNTRGVDRVRLATLSSWNGVRFTVSTADSDSRYTRLSTGRAPNGSQQVTVTMLSGYQGIWVPLPNGVMTAPTFTGPRATTLAESYYQDRNSGSALVAAGLQPGDRYSVAVTPAKNPSLGSPGAASEIDLMAYPNLNAWIKAQNVPRTAAGLTELLKRLSARGYLSHALVSDATSSQWIQALQSSSPYEFQASYAGHSTGRLEDLFAQLVNQQHQAGPNADPTQLVAGVGDDEQFAAAAALVARAEGYDSRVVMGMRLTADLTGGVAPCASACVAGNLAAWVEVRAPGGSDWTTCDVDPQFTVKPVALSAGQRFPKNPTLPQQPKTNSVEPPQQQNSAAQSQKANTSRSDAWIGVLLGVLRVTGIVLLFIVLALLPALVLATAKLYRRRRRRGIGVPEAAVVGAWDELLAAWADVGLSPVGQTRSAIAASSGSANAAQLAMLVDRAVFAEQAPDASVADAAWTLVDRECDRLHRGERFWRRVRRAVSPVSLWRDTGVRFRWHLRRENSQKYQESSTK